ncbi:S41 family peptidase [Microtetraspora niveoalba]|uniref:S41 family peptidase n=1 Tax=Microtetraspora niveoalba TaxID=46175 RepID=UPI00082E3C5C|nr:S41 family peptidase [Microtetraspora niveoalba]
MTSGSYLRFPHVHRRSLTFVAEDDVWIAPLDGGRAWRLTVDHAGAGHPRFSPDGARIAWTAHRDGDPEIHLAEIGGGPATRLTCWGDPRTEARGWLDDRTVAAVSAREQPFTFWTWAYAVPDDGRPATRQPYGPVADLHVSGGDTLLLTGTAGHDPAHWKRYRGGGTGRLWFNGRRLLDGHEGQIASPMIVEGRIAFLSDHEGVGNVYSCAPDGSDLRRHTWYEDFYARQASTDGRRIVYSRAGELWLLPGLDARPERLEVTLGGAGTGRRPYPAPPSVDGLACDATGRASAVEVAGAVLWLTHEDGPARCLDARPGVRARLPIVLGAVYAAEGEEAARRGNGPVAWVSDAGGEDGIELAEPGDAVRGLARGLLGRVLELSGSPDGTAIAVVTHDGRLLLVDVTRGAAAGGAGAAVTELARSESGPPSGPRFSPDSAWLAWSHPGVGSLRAIRMARMPSRTPHPDAAAPAERPEPLVVEVTDGRFTDTEPVFTPDGRYLAFLSRRGFDPIFDVHSFDLAFPAGSRPFLLPLARSTPSPFAPSVDGRPAEPEEAGGGDVVVDTEGMAGRVIGLPVPEGRYTSLQAVKDGLAWLRHPLRGSLGGGEAAPPPPPVLERFDLGKRSCEEVAAADAFSASGDGTRIAYVEGRTMRVTGGSGDPVEVDLRRIRVEVDPPRRWRQAYAEAGRLVRDHFWVADLAGVDWPSALAAYRPWLDRISGADDFADVLGEVLGELASSHAYVRPGAGPSGRSYRFVGMLGADLAPDTDGLWRVRRVLPAESSDPHARSPLAGSGVRPGDAVLAVDGRPVDPRTGPAPLLVDTAGRPVELTVESGDRVFRVAVVPLWDDRTLRYHAWVAERRQRVRRLSGGRAGYLHVPDMDASGWAQLHRDLGRELAREALVVDVRGNRGGFTSQLVLEKLSRRIVGWDVSRHHEPASYPAQAPRGPVVVVCDEATCSDGDVITGAAQALGLGPVVGARTWGGVIGYDEWHRLGDGTSLTVPGYAYWLRGYGWDLENRGAVPDVEVLITPADWAVGADPQLDTAVRLAMERLAAAPAAAPPDPATRPTRGRTAP